MVNRYLVFCGDVYYAGGGWCDFIGSFSSLEEAKGKDTEANIDDKSGTWCHIVDISTGEVVYERKHAHGGHQLTQERSRTAR